MKKILIVVVGFIVVLLVIGGFVSLISRSSRSISEQYLANSGENGVCENKQLLTNKSEGQIVATLKVAAEEKEGDIIADASIPSEVLQQIPSSVLDVKPNTTIESSENTSGDISDTPSGDRLDEPPGIKNDESLPLSMLAQINGFVAESKCTAGPEANALGEQLLNSTNPLLRVAGVAVLSENDGLTEDILKKIASDKDMSVAINSIGWMSDSGYADASKSINEILSKRGISKDDLLDLIAGNDLNSSGSRFALEMLGDKITEEEAVDVYGSVGADEAMAYSVRMKALLELKKKLGFVAYRDIVNELNDNSSAEDAVWKEGIKRLADSLEGPVPALSGPVVLTPDNIDEALSREYPMTLEDMAQKLENAVSSDDSFIQKGTAERLQERLEKLNDRPWDEEQQISLNRINAILESLAAKERPVTEAPPNFIEPPPGAGNTELTE